LPFFFLFSFDLPVAVGLYFSPWPFLDSPPPMDSLVLSQAVRSEPLNATRDREPPSASFQSLVQFRPPDDGVTQVSPVLHPALSRLLEKTWGFHGSSISRFTSRGPLGFHPTSTSSSFFRPLLSLYKSSPPKLFSFLPPFSFHSL